MQRSSVRPLGVLGAVAAATILACVLEPNPLDGKRCSSAHPCPSPWLCARAPGSDEGVCASSLPDGGTQGGGDSGTDAGDGGPSDGGVSDGGDAGEPSSCPVPSARPACELTLGVCANAVRPCDGGVMPELCPVSAYGSAYEPVELTCDGQDNDCDGRADLSTLTPVLAGSSRGSIASIDGGFVLLAEIDGGLELLRLGEALSVEARAQIAGRARAPAIDAFGPTLGVAFVDEQRQPAKLVSALLDFDGGVSVTSELALASDVAQGPRLHFTGNGSALDVVWVADGGTVFGATLDAVSLAGAGVPLAAPDAGAEQVVAVDVAQQGAGWVVVVGWSAWRGAQAWVDFVKYDARGFVAQAATATQVTGEAPLDLRVAQVPPLGIYGTWIEHPSTGQFQVRAKENVLGTTAPKLLAAGSQTPRALGITGVGGAPVVSYLDAQTQRLVAVHTDGGASVTFAEGVTGGAVCAWTDGLYVAVTLDGGVGAVERACGF